MEVISNRVVRDRSPPDGAKEAPDDGLEDICTIIGDLERLANDTQAVADRVSAKVG